MTNLQDIELRQPHEVLVTPALNVSVFPSSVVFLFFCCRYFSSSIQASTIHSVHPVAHKFRFPADICQGPAKSVTTCGNTSKQKQNHRFIQRGSRLSNNLFIHPSASYVFFSSCLFIYLYICLSVCLSVLCVH